jgi:hypothetical protein
MNPQVAFQARDYRSRRIVDARPGADPFVEPRTRGQGEEVVVGVADGDLGFRAVLARIRVEPVGSRG